MKAEIVRITPSLAAKWLRQNTDNRVIRRSVVDGYKDAFGRGEYVTSHQGVAFIDGVLADGQHRLTAIAEMPTAFAVDILVCRDVDPRAKSVMDIGLKRTAADVLGEDRKLVETARFLALLYVGKNRGISPQFLIPFIDRLREPHDALMAFCPSACKMWSSAPMRAAVCAIALAGGDMDYAQLVYRALVAKDFTTMPRCAQSLFRAHLNGNVSASHAVDTFVRALRIFNPANADNSKVQIKDISVAVETVRDLLRREMFGAHEPKSTERRPRAQRANGSYALAGI